MKIQWGIWNILQKISIVTGGIAIAYFAMQLARYNTTFSNELLMPHMKEMVTVLLASSVVFGVTTCIKRKMTDCRL